MYARGFYAKSLKIKYDKNMRKTLILFLFLFSIHIQAKQLFSVYDMTCEQASNPLGVDNESPCFSWKINSQNRDFSQSAYQILIAETGDAINTENGSVWNTGKISSSQSILVNYAGRPLKSAKTYYWKVKVWNKEGEASDWSEANTFTTGLLKPGDWGKSQWIALEKDKDKVAGVHGLEKKEIPDNEVGMYKMPQFRKEFKLTKKVKQALVFVSGVGHFDLFLNGTKVGDHFLDPGWTMYSKEVLYVTFDITNELYQGTNTLGVMLGNGFYNIPKKRYYKLLTSYGAPKVKLNLRIIYDDNSVEEVVTDKTWKVTESPVVFSSIYSGEDYDATKELDGWMKAGYDSKKWAEPIIAVYDPIMKSQQSAPLTVKEKIPVVRIYPNGKGWVYDLGQNFSGVVTLSVKADKGKTIRLIPAELLNNDSTANQSASGAPFYFNYTAKGSGEIETWQPQFTYYGFRYVQVEGAVPEGKENPDNLPVITNLAGLHTCNAAPEAGTFDCSNPMFNKIHNLVDWAMRSNMASVLTDCPHREKLGWLEQVYLMQYSLQYRYDLSRLYTKMMSDMRAAQTEKNVIPSIAPEYVRFSPDFSDSPEWGSAFIISAWYAYLWYGDERYIADYYPYMQKYLDYLTSRAEDHIVSHGLGDWYDLGPEKPGYSQLTTKGVTATSTYYYDVTILQKMAELLGKSEDVERYKNLAADIKKAYNDKFFDKNTKIYDRNSQTANAITLYMNLMDDANKEKVLSNLVGDIKERGNALTAGDVGYRYLLRALEANGQSELIYAMNSKYDVPGYGWQLAHGATALTESWQAYGFVSNNHFMLGHLMEWLYSGLGGIRQAEGSVGYKTVLIDPQMVGDITNARTTYESPYGKIRCEWAKSNNEYVINVSVPANSEAIVYLPALDESSVTEYGLPLDAADGVAVMNNGVDGKLRVKIGSGNYQFKVKR